MQFYEGNAAIPLIEEKNFYNLNILHTLSFLFMHLSMFSPRGGAGDSHGELDIFEKWGSNS